MGLSDSWLRSVNGKPYSGKSEVTDADGLSVRVSPKGLITFQIRHMKDGKQVRRTLGRYPALSLKDARVLAADMKTSPERYEKKPASPTPQALFDEWFEKHVVRNCRPGTQTNYKYVFGAGMNRMPELPVDEITIDMWLSYFDAINQRSPGICYALIAGIKACFSWHVRRGRIQPPCMMALRSSDIASKSKPGTRVLTVGEIGKIWRAIEASRACTSNKVVHLLCLVYGCRLSEARTVRHEDLDWDEMVWTVPAEISKTGLPITRPISYIGEQLFRRAMLATDSDTYLMPGADKKPIEIHSCNRLVMRLRANLGLPHWRIHDTRRTISTRLSEMGVMPHVTETMLGHKLSGIMTVYNKHNWLAEQREAYEMWWRAISLDLGHAVNP